MKYFFQEHVISSFQALATFIRALKLASWNAGRKRPWENIFERRLNEKRVLVSGRSATNEGIKSDKILDGSC